MSIIGQVFGDITVVDSSTVRTVNGHPRAILTVRCSCGKVYDTNRASVTGGKVKRCVDCSTAKKVKSGEGWSRHPLFRTWRGMLARCHDETHVYYKNYGARGIYVCSQWRSGAQGFKRFVSDMGPKPSKAHTLDRIDNDGPYSPENCRWSTRSEQQTNTRRPALVVKMGEHTKTLRAWCCLLGLPYENVLRDAKNYGGKGAILHAYARYVD